MHQKKIPRVKNILHSIPILGKKVYGKKNSSSLSSFLNNRSIVIKNKHLRYVSSSIPLACSVALLLLSICMFIPNNHSSVFALYENNSQDESTLDNSDSSRALTINPIATLTVTPSAETPQETLTGPNQTVYRTHDISITLNDVSSYGLSISYADNTNNTLKYEGDGTGNSTITGANNQSGAALIPNTWGYAWDTTSTNNSDLLYQTMPNYGDNSHKLISANDVSADTELGTIDGRIVFAAKFADDAPYGHYRTKVLLSLAAMPHIVTNYQVTYDCTGGTNCPENFSEESLASTYTYQIPNNTPTKANYTFLGYSTSNTATTAEYTANATIDLSQDNPSKDLYAVWKANGPAVSGFGDIQRMQDMTSAICKGASIGTTGQLYDARDDATYTIRRHEDGVCWMTQNLRITRESIKKKDSSNTTGKITSTDSNVSSSGYSIPASSTKSWSTTSNIEAVFYDGSDVYGGYYTWCAATAGCSNNSYSICPKGWKLPTPTDYGNLISKANLTVDKGLASPYSFVRGGKTLGDGFIFRNNNGYYWTGVPSSESDANRFYIGGGITTGGTDGVQKHFGDSVRCIAK